VILIDSSSVKILCFWRGAPLEASLTAFHVASVHNKEATVARKETIKPPTRPELKDASGLLRGGSSAGGRVMADKSVYIRQHPPKGGGKK
jgi:hypothetical protein